MYFWEVDERDLGISQTRNRLPLTSSPAGSHDGVRQREEVRMGALSHIR